MRECELRKFIVDLSLVFGEQRDALVLNVVATAVENRVHALCLLLGVLELHTEQLDDVVGEVEEEAEDLLFTRAEKNTIPLIEGQISALQDLKVLFERLWVAAEAFDGHALDRLPHATLIVPADRRNLFAIKSVRDVVLAILGLRPFALLPLALDLVKQGYVLVKFHKAEEADEAVHDVLLEVHLDAESTLHMTCV